MNTVIRLNREAADVDKDMMTENWSCSKFFADKVWGNVDLDLLPLLKIDGHVTMVFYYTGPMIDIRGNEIFIGNDHATFSRKIMGDIYLLTSGFKGATEKTITPQHMAFDKPRVAELAHKHKVSQIAVKLSPIEIIMV